jgi:hypothetical protein
MLAAETWTKTLDSKIDPALCWSNFWEYAKHVKTEDIDDEGRIRPFPLDYPYLHDFIDKLEDPKIAVIAAEKSRRMIISTTMMAWCDYNMGRVQAEETGELWAACTIIKNEEDAKKLIRRCKRIHQRLPSVLRRKYSIDNVLQLEIAGGGFLEGLNAGGQGPRQEGYRVGIMDEAGFQLRARENYRALRQCVQKIVVISSANGVGNLHHDLISGKIPGAVVVRMHYSHHPHRKPGTPDGDKWYARARIGVSEVDWQREQEIAYDIFAEEGWYTTDFNEACVQAVEWDGKSPITIGIDNGFVRAGAVVSYVNEYGQWCRMKEFLGQEELTDVYCARIFEFCRSSYPEAQYRIVCDPAAGQRKSIKDSGGANTDIDVINRTAKAVFGLPVFCQYDRIRRLQRKDGHREVRQQFKMRGDNRLGTIIDPTGCPILLEGFRGGYRQPEKATPHQIELEEPNRTSDHVHIMDADRYPVMQFTVAPSVPKYLPAQEEKSHHKPRPGKTANRILSRSKGKWGKVPTKRA